MDSWRSGAAMRGHTDRAEAEMAVHVEALTQPVGQLIEAVLRKHHRAVLEAVKELHERATKAEAERDALRAAFDAACAFIDSHVADPDITAEMAAKYATFLNHRALIEEAT